MFRTSSAGQWPRNDVDWRAALDYSYEERDREGNSTKTYEVTMIEGSPYQRLILINGKPLAAQVRAHEEMKFQETLSTRRGPSRNIKGTSASPSLNRIVSGTMC